MSRFTSYQSNLPPGCLDADSGASGEGTPSCRKCEVDFETAGQGEHMRGLCQSCEGDEMQRQDEVAEAAVVAELVEQLQQCLDGTAHHIHVQNACRGGRMLLARWQQEGREL